VAATLSGVSTPSEPQVQGPTDPAAANMVRVCDRCGTVCSADQEWCLNCGVRMSETSQRLPGLRAAGLVVALAVLLAGGAAAASYAALRGDARKTANLPGPTTTAPPVAQTPAPVAPATPAPAPVAPTATAPPTSTGKKAPTTSTPKATPAPSTGNATPNSSDNGSATTTTATTKTTATTPTTTKTTPTTPSGPITFASGQGSIYDPDTVASDTGDEGKAIDGSTSTSWKFTLKDGQTGGLGYVLDFDDPTTIRKLKIQTPTAGLEVKILGTSKSALPDDVLDSRWETLSAEKTLKSGSNAIALKAVSGATSKYRHVLVLFTTVPDGTATIREFTASR
jgi:hypothetical protein